MKVDNWEKDRDLTFVSTVFSVVIAPGVRNIHMHTYAGIVDFISGGQVLQKVQHNRTAFCAWHTGRTLMNTLPTPTSPARSSYSVYQGYTFVFSVHALESYASASWPLF